jgi:thiosulfate/3-mercaptopyruvate sulfurtransferase
MPYAHPEALVSSEWLAAHLDDPHVRIVDASFTLPGVAPTARENYEAGHLPGAVFFDIDDIAAPGTSLPHMIPSADLFARKIGALGVGDGDKVVVYDSAGLSSAGRAWWMLRLFGHREVALLDGGVPKWQSEGRSLTTVVLAPARRHFTARFDPSLVRDKMAVLANLASRREQIVDARAAGRFDGSTPEVRAYPRQPQPSLRPADRSRDAPDQECGSALGLVPRCRGGARPTDRDQLRLGRHRLRARLCAASDRPFGDCGI